jgi:hypothetical protein
MKLWLLLLWVLSLTSKIVLFSDENFFQMWRNKYKAASGNQKPPKFYKEWILLARQMESSEDPSDYKQIFMDLKQFKNQNLTIESVVKKYSEIRNSGPYVDIIRMKEFIKFSKSDDWAFKNSLELVPEVLDPHIDFALIIHKYDEYIVAVANDSSKRLYKSMRDVMSRSNNVRYQWLNYSNSCMHLQAPKTFISFPFLAPVFGVNKLKGYSDILLPTTRNGLPVYKKYLNIALSSPPWKEKANKAMFRGRSTGVNFVKARLENIPLTNSPRFKLHEMSMQQQIGLLNCSVKLDFGLTDLWQYNDKPIYAQAILSKYPLIDSLDFQTQFKSKYLVIVDGNAWPDRVAFYLLSGSLVFLSTLHEEWVINQLIDGENYIKVKPDLSDLIEKLEWASKNDDIAEIIALNGRKLAQKRLNINQIQIYNALLFMEYQKLFEKSS